MEEASKNTEEYFLRLEKGLKTCYDLANEARKKGIDPEDHVEIPLAKNMAERVEGLISAIAPQIVGCGISKRISQLEKKYGSLDWRISLLIAEEIAQEKFCKFKDKLEAIEIGIRVGFAYHTMGSVSSPIEGFVKLQPRQRKDGKEYLAMFFSGPIRSAGGTGASVSVLITDYMRRKFGYHPYDPTDDEINRMAIELYDYHERITNLQYLPSVDEIKFLVKHLPIQIDGDPSEKIEVSNYKDLPRVETNNIRNGVCLVLGEGIAQKAPKLWKQLSKWGKDFGLEDWGFLQDFIKLQKSVKSGKGKEDPSLTGSRVAPDYTFIKDLVAGRPILTHPLATGGFRLRYGRSRTSGYSSYSIHPAAMYAMDRYIATATQLKVERPGKGCTVTCCDSIEGPIVLLENGDVLRFDDEKTAKLHVKEIKKILFLGDILINYGDFFNRAHTLIPPGYCEEWWVQELEKGVVDLFGSLDLDKLEEMAEIPKRSIESIMKNPFTTKISAEAAITLSKKLNIPMHPYYTYHWKSISIEDLNILIKWILKINIKKENGKILKVVLPYEQEPKTVLETLGVPHNLVNKEFVVVEKEDARALMAQLGMDNGVGSEQLIKLTEDVKLNNVLDIICTISSVKIRDKSGYFIGARMGRPEKAKMRQLTGSPHVLFPVGDEGGRLRSFQAALQAGKVNGEFPVFRCTKCEKETIYSLCETCGKKTKRMYFCPSCGVIEKDSCSHGECSLFRNQDLDIKYYFSTAVKNLQLNDLPDLIKGVRGTSNKDHTPEPLFKGILRAANEVFVNKDGTTRYDMSQMPITHFKAKEIGTSIEKLKELGYTQDIFGKELEHSDQIIELKVQDIILPSNQDAMDLGADKSFFKVARFIDEMLVRAYGLKPFYNLKKPDDLIGHLGLVLAPHTSAGTLVRIIGFSKTQGLFAHPMLHAATRRDCDGDEASVSLLLDMLLNFSRKYLPSHRGSTQDVCLVATSKLIPSEIDDMVFDMDIAWKYPLEFYRACIDFKKPWDVELAQISKVLGTEKQYSGMGFTHPTSDFNRGVRCSAYKTIPAMEEKLKGQMELANKIRAVDEKDVAKRVIEKHFLKDIKGNLRKFSMQKFRCVNCNQKFRRPPITGKCTKCQGKIIFTISEGSVIKYLEPSISLANKYELPSYLQQTLDLLRQRVDTVFGKDKEKQEGLGKWFG